MIDLTTAMFILMGIALAILIAALIRRNANPAAPVVVSPVTYFPIDPNHAATGSFTPDNGTWGEFSDTYSAHGCTRHAVSREVALARANTEAEVAHGILLDRERRAQERAALYAGRGNLLTGGYPALPPFMATQQTMQGSAEAPPPKPKEEQKEKSYTLNELKVLKVLMAQPPAQQGGGKKTGGQKDDENKKS